MESTAALRADAARNREAILCAAARVYARDGIEVSLEDVARAAGVGVGTVYRRFPSKPALLEALFVGKMTAYADHSEAAADRAVREPWPAFSDHLRFLLHEQAIDVGFSEVVQDPAGGSEAFREQHHRAFRASLQLVQAATDAGVLRAGFRHTDLLIVTRANHGLVRAAGGTAVADSARFADYVLDAFSA